MIHKMYCIFAMESIKKMNGNRGKLGTQAGHAYLHSFWNSLEYKWKGDETLHIFHQAMLYMNSQKAFKITLVVDTVAELIVLQEKYKNICGTSLVTDAGLTVFNEPTTTCLGIGPISEENIGEDLKALKTLL